MSDETTNQAMEYVPTWKDRLARKLFPYRLQEFTEPPNMNGWMRTNINVHLSIADRLRLLIGGRLLIETTTYTEHQVPHAESFSSVNVLAPWE